MAVCISQQSLKIYDNNRSFCGYNSSNTYITENFRSFSSLWSIPHRKYSVCVESLNFSVNMLARCEVRNVHWIWNWNLKHTLQQTNILSRHNSDTQKRAKQKDIIIEWNCFKNERESEREGELYEYIVCVLMMLNHKQFVTYTMVYH